MLFTNQQSIDYYLSLAATMLTLNLPMHLSDNYHEALRITVLYIIKYINVFIRRLQSN